MKLKLLTCSLLALAASCASSSKTFDERAAAAVAHEFDMEMTGAEKVDQFIIAASVILEVYKANLVETKARWDFPALDSFNGAVNNELEAAGIDLEAATEEQRAEAARTVAEGMGADARAALQTQGQAWTAFGSALERALTNALRAKGVRMITKEQLQELTEDEDLAEKLGGGMEAALVLKDVADHGQQALDNISLKEDIDSAFALFEAAAGDL